MLSQNELQIAQGFLATLISGRTSNEFDPRSLGGPKLDDITYFNKYIRSLRLYELEKNKTGSYKVTQDESKVTWFYDNNFNPEDVEAFEMEILRQLKHYYRNSYKPSTTDGNAGAGTAIIDLDKIDLTDPNFDFDKLQEDINK